MLNMSPASEWECLTWTAYIFLRDRPASFIVQKEDLRRVNLYATLELLITDTMKCVVLRWQISRRRATAAQRKTWKVNRFCSVLELISASY